MFRRSLLATGVLAALLPLAANAASTRTHVSNAGSDANTAFSCDYAHPCRTFAAALTVTTPGGEILAIDSSGYGKVTIDRSVSIIAAPGVYAGIGVGSGNGVTIATAGVDVVLRGLTITGQGGSSGINMSAGNSLIVQDCTIRNFAPGNGLYVSAAARVRLLDSLLQGNFSGARFLSGSTVLVSGSRFIDNAISGFYAGASGAGLNTKVEIARSEASGNGVGFQIEALSGSRVEVNIKDSVMSRNAHGVHSYGSGSTLVASVSGSLVSGNSTAGLFATSGAKLVAAGNAITHNGIGMAQSLAAVLQSTGDNILSDNATDTSGTITSLVKQ